MTPPIDVLIQQMDEAILLLDYDRMIVLLRQHGIRLPDQSYEAAIKYSNCRDARWGRDFHGLERAWLISHGYRDTYAGVRPGLE